MNITSAKILLIEDNSGYLTELKNWLKDCGYEHIDEARNTTEANEKLESGFDIIITDMRMENDDSGFDIIDKVKELNITSIIIILTANENVLDCRRAFKAEVWDYIPKTLEGGFGIEETEKSMREGMTYLNRWGNRKDKQWLEANSEYLQENYLDQYVAIINQNVIEFAETEEELKAKIQERKLPLFIPIIQKIEIVNIEKLLQQEESNTLEFKGSFYYDSNEDNNKNNGLRFNNLKTIAAFLNSEGGTLLIGVTDDKAIYGVENDFLVSSKKQNQDGFELALNDMISHYIGAEFFQFIKIAFVKIEDKQVCAVVVKKSTKVAFIESSDKKKTPKLLYIRKGNSSQKLINPEEIYNYCQMQK